jgi:N-acetyl-anhydromuramyl-L-alanine amidase AmpD
MVSLLLVSFGNGSDYQATFKGTRMTDFIQSLNYNKANRSDIRLVVIHTMENPEKPGTARQVAKWFASASAPQASAHACVDNQEVVLCVRAEDVAWAAPGANRDGYHIEHAGRASQDDAGWHDEYSQAMLRLSAAHAADICKRYEIPAVKLTVEEVRAGKAKGFCGHVDVTFAFRKSTHTDPGRSFPWDEYLVLVREQMHTGDVLDKLDKADTDPAPAPDDVEGAAV